MLTVQDGPSTWICPLVALGSRITFPYRRMTFRWPYRLSLTRKAGLSGVPCKQADAATFCHDAASIGPGSQPTTDVLPALDAWSNFAHVVCSPGMAPTASSSHPGARAASKIV